MTRHVSKATLPPPSKPVAVDKRDMSEIVGPELTADEVKALYRGLWYVLTMEAAAIAQEKNYRRLIQRKEAFVLLVNDYKERFPCHKCREHIVIYETKHPILVVMNQDDQRGALRWVWQFHNEVNMYLKKPRYPWEQVEKDWLIGTAGGCEYGCAAE